MTFKENAEQIINANRALYKGANEAAIRKIFIDRRIINGKTAANGLMGTVWNGEDRAGIKYEIEFPLTYNCDSMYVSAASPGGIGFPI